MIKRILEKLGLNNIIKNFIITTGIIESRVVGYDTLIPQMVEIGKNFIAEPGATITAHDGSIFMHTGKAKIEKVIIGDNVYLGANCVILPGVTIGDNTVIRAGSIVSQDIPSNVIVSGNPARIVSTVDEYIAVCEDNNTLYSAPEIFNTKFLKGIPLTIKDKIEFQKFVLQQMEIKKIG